MNPLFRLELKILLRWISFQIIRNLALLLFAFGVVLGIMQAVVVIIQTLIWQDIWHSPKAIFFTIVPFMSFIPAFIQKATDPLAYTVPISAKDRMKSRLFLMGCVGLIFFVFGSVIGGLISYQLHGAMETNTVIFYSLNCALSGLFISLLCGICLSIRMRLLSIFLIPGALILVICLTLLFF